MAERCEGMVPGARQNALIVGHYLAKEWARNRRRPS